MCPFVSPHTGYQSILEDLHSGPSTQSSHRPPSPLELEPIPDLPLDPPTLSHSWGYQCLTDESILGPPEKPPTRPQDLSLSQKLDTPENTHSPPCAPVETYPPFPCPKYYDLALNPTIYIIPPPYTPPSTPCSDWTFQATIHTQEEEEPIHTTHQNKEEEMLTPKHPITPSTEPCKQPLSPSTDPSEHLPEGQEEVAPSSSLPSSFSFPSPRQPHPVGGEQAAACQKGLEAVPQPWAQALAALQTKEGEEEEAEERVREGEEDRDESKNKKEVEEKKEEMPYSFPEWVEIEGCCEVEVDVVKMKDSVREGKLDADKVEEEGKKVEERGREGEMDSEEVQDKEKEGEVDVEPMEKRGMKVEVDTDKMKQRGKEGELEAEKVERDKRVEEKGEDGEVDPVKVEERGMEGEVDPVKVEERGKIGRAHV